MVREAKLLLVSRKTWIYSGARSNDRKPELRAVRTAHLGWKGSGLFGDRHCGRLWCRHDFCAVVLAANAQWFFDTFTFSTFGALEQFHLWQFVSYAFVVFEPREYLWIALQLFFLASFGREVEKFIGRASFAWFYGALLLAPPIFLSLLSLAGSQHIYAGSGAVNFAVFIAFAYIYPRAEIFMSIEARWVALVLLGINSLMLLGGQNATGLGILWLECIVAVGWMIKEGVGTFELPSPAAFFKRKTLSAQIACRAQK